MPVRTVLDGRQYSIRLQLRAGLKQPPYICLVICAHCCVIRRELEFHLQTAALSQFECLHTSQATQCSCDKSVGATNPLHTASATRAKGAFARVKCTLSPGGALNHPRHAALTVAASACKGAKK
eukprot:5423385-Amphidinium_carterae.2